MPEDKTILKPATYRFEPLILDALKEFSYYRRTTLNKAMTEIVETGLKTIFNTINNEQTPDSEWNLALPFRQAYIKLEESK